MAIEVGAIAAGKVTGIMRYGAFVTLEDKTVGMVHISEISHQYVNDINEVLKLGQDVRVKVLSVDENNRISFSIKKAEPTPPRRERAMPSFEKRTAPVPKLEMTFEDKLKEFMQSSNSHISDLKHNTDRKTGQRRKK